MFGKISRLFFKIHKTLSFFISISAGRFDNFPYFVYNKTVSDSGSCGALKQTRVEPYQVQFSSAYVQRGKSELHTAG